MTLRPERREDDKLPRCWHYSSESHACPEAVEWVGKRDLATAWQDCERADWLLWLCGMMADKDGWPSCPQVVLAACACARRALRFVPAGEDRPRLAIEAAEQWAFRPSDKAAARAGEAAGEAAWTAAWTAGEAARAEHRAMAELIRSMLTRC